jgi:diguanylate cyclase (GGDEF)-like protein
MVRAAVQDLAVPHATSIYQTVTVSIGVAAATPSELQQPGDLVEAADAALYAAKHRGRNAVVEHGFAQAPDGTTPMALAS